MNKGSNPLHIKGHNLAVVKKALRTLQTATRQEIAKETGLTTVTVAGILQTLVANKEVMEGDQIPSNGGRPSYVYHFNPSSSHVLLIFTREIEGRDTIFYRVANLYGHIVHRLEQTKTPDSLGCFDEAIGQLLKSYPNISVIGFCLPGIAVDGKIEFVDYPFLIGSKIVDYFSNKYKRPTIFENDVNAAAVGFYQKAGLDAKSLVYIYSPMKYAPGSGLIIEGKLFRGKTNYAGEIAYLPLRPSDGTKIDYLAKVVVSLCAVLNPHEVIVHAEFLGALDFDQLKKEALRLIPEIAHPTINLSTDFTGDIEAGMANLCLQVLSN